jgi:septin family protein
LPRRDSFERDWEIAIADNMAIVIEENGVRLRLNIVDTPGYGDQVNNDRWYEYTPDMLLLLLYGFDMHYYRLGLTWH